MTYPLYLLHQQIGAAAAAAFGPGALPAALLLVTLSGIYYLLASHSTLVRDTLTVVLKSTKKFRQT